MSEVNVVQFSLTPLAGAPIRIANAVNKLEGFSVRHVDLIKSRAYPSDLVFSKDSEEVLELCESADIIHLYNYANLYTKEFTGVDFKALRKRGKVVFQHFQSTPMAVASYLGWNVEDVLNHPLPKVVIAQYPERFFPDARVVPNIIPQDDPHYIPRQADNLYDLVFSPTWHRSAWEWRWDTKGMPETVKMLQQAKARYGINYKVMHGCTLDEVMRAKADSLMVIDELVTGSYHLSALEGLSLGKVVLCYIDPRADYVLRYISGSSSIPFLNVRLEDSLEVVGYLKGSPSTTRQIGEASRKWIEGYWKDTELAKHFKNLYEDLLNNPRGLSRQPDLLLEDSATKFLAVNYPDCIYESRKDLAYKTQPLITRNFTRIQKILRKFVKASMPEKHVSNLQKFLAKRKRRKKQIF